MEDALSHLAARGWYGALVPELQARLAAIARLVRFENGATLYEAGDPPNGAFGIVEGLVRIGVPSEDGHHYRVLVAAEGSWIGAGTTLTDAPRLVSAVAAEATSAVQLPGPELRRLVETEPRLSRALLLLEGENRRLLLRTLGTLAVPQADRRVALSLLLQDELHGASDRWIPLGRAEIAELAATSVPTLRRVLVRLGREGMVEVGYRRLRILDRDRLAAFAAGTA